MPSPVTPEQAKARAIVAGITAAVDLQDWARLQTLFEDQLTLDYTSLWGGTPQEISREELLHQWRSLLPGFDATWHQLGEAEVSVDRPHARVTTPVKGIHLIGGEAWIVEGRYEVALACFHDRWRIRALTYLNERETGDRKLAEIAKQRATASA